jgi:hypothetical protein
LKEAGQAFERGDGCGGMSMLQNGLDSREVSSGKERVRLENTGGIRRLQTFDGDELDHDDAETEAFVRARLKLHLSGDCVAGDVKWV